MSPGDVLCYGLLVGILFILGLVATAAAGETISSIWGAIGFLLGGALIGAAFGFFFGPLVAGVLHLELWRGMLLSAIGIAGIFDLMMIIIFLKVR